MSAAASRINVEQPIHHIRQSVAGLWAYLDAAAINRKAIALVTVRGLYEPLTESTQLRRTRSLVQPETLRRTLPSLSMSTNLGTPPTS